MKDVKHAAHDARYTRFFGLKFNLKTDLDIITHLAAVRQREPLQTYLKRLIRADIWQDPSAVPSFAVETGGYRTYYAARADAEAALREIPEESATLFHVEKDGSLSPIMTRKGKDEQA